MKLQLGNQNTTNVDKLKDVSTFIRILFQF